MPHRMGRVTILCDPITDPYGVNRVTIHLANYFAGSHDVEVVSPTVVDGVRSHFSSRRITLSDLGERLISRSPSFAYAEAWAREALFRMNGGAWDRRRPADTGVVINLSNTVTAPSDVWYLQGAVGYAISKVASVALGQRSSGPGLLSPLLDTMDRIQIRAVSSRARRRIANSNYCKSSYRQFGVRVDEVVYPPLDTSVFRPLTENPSADYCVAYLGKETDPEIVFALAEAGVRLRVFGSKIERVPPKLAHHRNISIEGRLTDRDLALLYSNAKLTIFPFTIEPFGYIPVESTACGTPVLTYNREGPSENIVDGQTGWTCRDPDEMVRRATKIWNDSAITPQMRTNCTRLSANFSVERIGERWLSIVEELSGSPAGRAGSSGA